MYKPLHVVGIGGTLRARSTSLWALEAALESAARAGASTDVLPLREWSLPFYTPGYSLDDYPPVVREFIERVAAADALLISSAGYHGTLAGVTKNALDFFEFLKSAERPYLQNRVVGLIATAGGDMANVHTVDTMTQIVHSLRGTVLPLQVAIPYAGQVFEADGSIKVAKWSQRLDALGQLAVETAARFQPQPELM